MRRPDYLDRARTFDADSVPPRIVLSVAQENAARVLECAVRDGVPAVMCGQVAEKGLRVVYNDVDILSMRAAELFAPGTKRWNRGFKNSGQCAVSSRESRPAAICEISSEIRIYEY